MHHSKSYTHAQHPPSRRVHVSVRSQKHVSSAVSSKSQIFGRKIIVSTPRCIAPSIRVVTVPSAILPGTGCFIRKIGIFDSKVLDPGTYSVIVSGGGGRGANGNGTFGGGGGGAGASVSFTLIITPTLPRRESFRIDLPEPGAVSKVISVTVHIVDDLVPFSRVVFIDPAGNASGSTGGTAGIASVVSSIGPDIKTNFVVSVPQPGANGTLTGGNGGNNVVNVPVVGTVVGFGGAGGSDTNDPKTKNGHPGTALGGGGGGGGVFFGIGALGTENFAQVCRVV